VKNDFAYHITKFFAEYLPLHIGASTNTCKSYRDVFVQLIAFTETKCRVKADKISLDVVNATLIEDFLLHLESVAGVGVSTRNQRLAAIHSFFKYLQKKELARFAQCSAVLSIRFKKNPPPVMTYLSIKETEILLSIPDSSTKKGLRDLAVLAVLYETAARVQELIDLTSANLHISDVVPYIELRGKGNKLRKIPIATEVADILVKYISAFSSSDSLKSSVFHNSQKRKLTRAGVQYDTNERDELLDWLKNSL